MAEPVPARACFGGRAASPSAGSPSSANSARTAAIVFKRPAVVESIDRSRDRRPSTRSDGSQLGQQAVGESPLPRATNTRDFQVTPQWPFRRLLGDRSSFLGARRRRMLRADLAQRDQAQSFARRHFDAPDTTCCLDSNGHLVCCCLQRRQRPDGSSPAHCWRSESRQERYASARHRRRA
jgi:hypothetical protein